MNPPEWMVHNVLSNFVFVILETLVMFIGIGLRKKFPDVAPYLLYAGGLGACTAVIYFSFVALQWFSIQPLRTTPLNVKAQIAGWLTQTRVSVRDASPESPDSIFTLAATLPNSQRIGVIRYKGDPEIITIRCEVMLTEYKKTEFQHLSKPEQIHLTERLEQALASTSDQFLVDLPQPVVIMGVVPIENINRYIFDQRFLSVQHALTQTLIILGDALHTVVKVPKITREKKQSATLPKKKRKG